MWDKYTDTLSLSKLFHFCPVCIYLFIRRDTLRTTTTTTNHPIPYHPILWCFSHCTKIQHLLLYTLYPTTRDVDSFICRSYNLIRVVHSTDHRVETPLPFSQSYIVPKYKEGIHCFQSRTPTKIFQALDEMGGLWWMSKPRRNVHVRKNIRNLFTTPLYIGCIIVLVGVKDDKIRPISKKIAAFSWQFSWCSVQLA